MLNYYQTVTLKTAAAHVAHTSIFIIYTGGTIGMDYQGDSRHLAPFNFEQIIDKVPELKRFDFELTVLSFFKLIDSSDVKIHNWLNIARIIYDFYNDFDAFVILHGTDTMAYSASAVSFLLHNLGKPVIFTGAQLPIGVPRTDARENFITALEIASARTPSGKPVVPEVCIFFDQFLLRGNRARKVQSETFTAFESENYEPLAVAGINIDFNQAKIMEPAVGQFEFYTKMDNNVALLKLFPGMPKRYVRHFLAMPGLRGIVMETFGSGNTPTDEWFTGAIREAVDAGIFVYNVSQCNGGKVVHGMYESSKKLEEIGVVSGRDITPEAAMTKLMFLLGNETDHQLIRRHLAVPLRGEMT
jgi:L-asparaginase